MTLSTHVLDTALGCPAAGVGVRVERQTSDGWALVTDVATGDDGRAGGLVPDSEWGAGVWRLVFDTGGYLGPRAFLPSVTVEFRVSTTAHHHIPLLLSPFGFSTYRGT